MRSFAVSPSSRIRVTRESPATNRAQPRIDESLRTGGDDGQDGIGPQSAKCEQQRPRGRPIDPLQIIDDQDDDLAVSLKAIEQVHQPLADDHRIGTGSVRASG
jgi:hypothetical protein